VDRALLVKELAMGVLRRCGVAGACGIVLAAALGQTASPAPMVVSAVRVTVEKVDGKAVEVSLRNTSGSPLFLNVGLIIGNDKRMVARGLEVEVQRAGATVTYGEKLGFVGGRVDDWIVPLSPEAGLTLRLPAEELVDRANSPLTLVAGDQVKVVLTGVKPSHQPETHIPSAAYWEGKATSEAVGVK
jgi:hypothetical protein